ncbi:IucA/IucC family protein [Amycolatopsis cihanbeyliensis]|uniref:Siderophore synthetase component n=1 Tax=Amycolatopsis cihanbeyliensis TaxID=1128664 RepID=A0A542DNE5_AMYCI|nr:IucA/IucC family protein [Amycolatopsis cihanbeyliensis]TQJ04618.1 siderophore synthetase component [Amycolatopsis cihanbeyliensis]
MTDDHLAAARRAARQRLLNSFLRETGRHTVSEGELRIPLTAAPGALVVQLCHRSILGQHTYADPAFRECPGRPRVPIGHAEFVATLLDEVAAVTGRGGARRKAELAAQIGNSVAHVARYLADRAGRKDDPARNAEQNVLLGHPFHPTPKSAEGFGARDLTRYAPELGASFVPHYFAVTPRLLAGRRVAPGCWVPERVAAHCPTGYRLLPAHPWQAGYLEQRAEVVELITGGELIALGPLGEPVYPTSSVRTVCDPGFPTCWKLPLHVRITNFVRNNPAEHLRRATDAAQVIARLRDRWPAGFGVLLETGYRTLDPEIVGGELAAEFAVLYRDNPCTGGAGSPRVLAGLLEEGPRGAEPELVRCVAEAGDVLAWLRRYLRISLLPLLTVFATDGVSFEAHVQNSLLATERGWPVRFWVRDLEGVSLSERHDLAADSPALYSPAEAWCRLRYHAVTNQLGHVLHVLGRYTGAAEERLWAVAREELAGLPYACVAELLRAPSLPAKANLLSRFADRSERPLFVDVPNPLREA